MTETMVDPNDPAGLARICHAVMSASAAAAGLPVGRTWLPDCPKGQELIRFCGEVLAARTTPITTEDDLRDAMDGVQAKISNVVITTGLKLWRLTWTPTGKEIALIGARSKRAAIRKAPVQYRRFPDKVAAEEVTRDDVEAMIAERRAE